MVDVLIPEPYDFALSVRVAGSHYGDPTLPVDRLQVGVHLGGQPVALTIRASARSAQRLEVTSSSPVPAGELERIVRWMLLADLDLHPFYRLAGDHPVLGQAIAKFRGLKPIRPASLLEMAVTVITEQQISMIAAYHIRTRLIQRFGDRVGEVWVFPKAETLAAASPEELRGCGLSQNKAVYIQELSRQVAEGSLALESLENLPDGDARAALLKVRGFGSWSADYFLVRGLVRLDAVPVEDVGMRRAIGKTLGSGSRPTPAEMAKMLEPFAPFRGLAAYYLSAWYRIR